MMVLDDNALVTLLGMLKNAAFQIAIALTVLVLLGIEMRRRRVMFSWLEERYQTVRQAWMISLGIAMTFSVLYALLDHNPVALAVDALTAIGMIAGVVYLDRSTPERTPRRRPRPQPDDEEDELPPPSNRYPRTRRRRRRRPPRPL